MADGSSKTFAIIDSVRAAVKSVAISSDGRLVAAGGFDAVHDLSSFNGAYSKYSSYTLGAKGNLPSGYIVSFLWVMKQFARLIPSR